MKSSELSSIALKYPGDKSAPLITAKETGMLAQRMIEIAKENNIPVVEDKIASSVLTYARIGDCIPQEAYEAVSKVFAMIRMMEKKA